MSGIALRTAASKFQVFFIQKAANIKGGKSATQGDARAWIASKISGTSARSSSVVVYRATRSADRTVYSSRRVGPEFINAETVGTTASTAVALFVTIDLSVSTEYDALAGGSDGRGGFESSVASTRVAASRTTITLFATINNSITTSDRYSHTS